jgi:hypothetical protein
MPAIGYPGGKARLARKIVSFLPKQGRMYVEPFVGRGNVFWAAVSAGLQYESWWLNDISTIPFFRSIKRIGHKIRVPQLRRAEYAHQKEAYKLGDLEAILLEPYLTFGGGGYAKGFKGDRTQCVSAVGYEKSIRACERIMDRIRPRLSSLDWRDMRLVDLGADDTLVIDPPYPDCRVSYSDTFVDYESLVDLLLQAKFRWVLCGYVHPLLCRLGDPFWASDVRLLCNAHGENESRTECLWSNFVPEVREPIKLPTTLNGRLRLLADATALSFPALEAKIDDGLQTVARDWNALLPYLLEMNRRLRAPGRRSDLRKGAPSGLTWTEWVQTKRSHLGRSLRTIQYLLRDKTEASRQRRMLTQRRAELRYEPKSSMPAAPMEIASAMARLILQTRENSQNLARLERLAEQFLSITGARDEGQSQYLVDSR